MNNQERGIIPTYIRIGLTQLDHQEYSEAVEDKPQRQVE